MGAPRVSVTGSTLSFDRQGTVLIAAEQDGIAVVDLVGPRTTRLPYSDARAVVGFDDQIWIATRVGQLLRVEHGGRVLGEPVLLPFAQHDVLVPASFGAPAAIWCASPPLAILDDFGCSAHVEVGDVDAALPITGRRWLVASATKLTLPSGVTALLAPGTSVLGGVVMSDGKAATLLVNRDGSRRLVLFSLGTAQVVHQLSVPPRTVPAEPTR